MARRLLRRLGLEPVTLRVDLTQVGGSALTDRSIPVPRFSPSRLTPPATYVPFRNGVFLAIAAAWAEARGVRDLACGFHVLDSPEYPDTRREFVRAMERAINLGTAAAAFGGAGARLRIHAPFIDMTKADIIRAGLRLGADYSYSVSCYAGGEIPCGVCSSCRLRARGWKEAGGEDQLLARLRKEGRI
jgi:7-cyano-7-deazaguanine synthase